jgi:hypothetical protein
VTYGSVVTDQYDFSWHNAMPLDFPLDVWINSYTDWDWLLPAKATLRDEWLARGKAYWWYWCVGPEQPEFLNTFVERPGIEARLLFCKIPSNREDLRSHFHL